MMMRHLRDVIFSYIALLLPIVLAGVGRAQVADVLTGQYNNARTAANLAETTLTPANVSPSTFGLLFTQQVDSSFYAQPLYVHGLTINGATHNVIFVATMRDTVYAFDADTAQAPLWSITLGNPVPTATLNVGILSTPVIDIGLQTLFVLAYTTQEDGPSVYRLHALNLLTGTEITNVSVQAAVPGTGDNTQTTACVSGNGGSVPPPCIPFMAGEELQRTALLEDANSNIYVAFGTANGEEATHPYHGWLIGYHYSGGAFTQTTVFASTQNATQTGRACSSPEPPSNQCGHGGGIWMSGRGPALDSTGIYAVTGNGGFGGAGTGNWGESVLRLSGGLVEDSFTADNYANLNGNDLDLGNAGALLFSSTNTTVPNLLVASGKAGMVYVLNRASLGGFTSTNGGAVQVLTQTPQGCGTGPGQNACYEIHSQAFWARTGAAPILYIWAWGDVLRAWDFNATSNQFSPDLHQGTLPAPYYPGGTLAVSANGNRDGIVWGITATTSSAPGQGEMYAFDAGNVSGPLWVSTDYWFITKFVVPLVANGKVYVSSSASPTGITPSYSPLLRVYGLCSSSPSGCVSAKPGSARPHAASRIK
jgi:hypothetical protein